MSYPYASSFSNDGAGVDGLVVSAYDVSRFESQPAFNDDPPDGDADATTTTGTAAGFAGAFTIELPTTDAYYLSIVNDEDIYWLGPLIGAVPGGGGGGGGSSIPPVIVVSVSATDMEASPPSGDATCDGYPVTTDNRVLLTAQATATDNGPWIANTAGDWTRPTDWATGATIVDGTLISVGNVVGDYLYGSVWSLADDVVVDTDPAGFVLVVAPSVLDLAANEAGIPQMELVPSVLDMTDGGLQLPLAVISGPGEVDPNTLAQTLTDTAVAVTLPSAGSAFGFWLKNMTGVAAVITPDGSDTIDGASTLTLPNLAAVFLQAAIGNWMILSSHGLG